MIDFTSLRQQLLDFIQTSSGDFNQLAVAIFQYQLTHNQAYKNYVEALEKGQIDTWQNIPALPTDAFKYHHLPLRCFSENKTIAHFLTSGTTQEIRGKHEFCELSLYETSILEAWKNIELPEIKRPIFLSPPFDSMPHSSLAWMFRTLSSSFDQPPHLILANGTLQQEPLLQLHQPVELFSTALGLLHFMEQFPPTPLPEGSWIFETGGYKGLRVDLDPASFRQKVANFFSIPSECILNEYSMTELSSQAYRWGNERCHRTPPWMKVRVIDPASGKLLTHGEIGYLEIIDLANLHSVMAIKTQDLAIWHDDQCFELLGRDSAALPRGCSRATDAFIQGV